MTSDVQTQVQVIKDIIARTIPVEQTYLFGFYAYGQPNKDSDLDF
jgi:predicted nucleotidyltransferase